MKRVFSGIQPTGNLHIGNYIGAVKQWVEGQNEGQNIFCIVDLHAITVEQDPKQLREKTLELAGIVIAAGVDPKKSLLFAQSHNPDHTNLAWVLNCFTGMGQLNRMTQFKDKSEGKDFISVGLFDYPVLMAADILLYDTSEVPVGDDQKQHVELARDIAERFNGKYGETFVMPTPVIPMEGARIMSLQEAGKKMSKSDTNPNGAIGLMDTTDIVKDKIMKAVTDSNPGVRPNSYGQAVKNLLEIYSQLSGKKVEEVVSEFEDKGYGDFKKALVEVVNNFLQPFQTRYNELRSSGELEDVLKTGAEKAYEISHKKLAEVYEKVGFIK